MREYPVVDLIYQSLVVGLICYKFNFAVIVNTNAGIYNMKLLKMKWGNLYIVIT